VCLPAGESVVVNRGDIAEQSAQAVNPLGNNDRTFFLHLSF